MKKLFPLVGLLALFSCSGSDDNGSSEDLLYNIRIMQNCPNGSRTLYCLTKSEYENATEDIGPGSPCQMVHFTSIDGEEVSGYFFSGGVGGECND